MPATILRFQRRGHGSDPALPAIVLYRGRQWEAWRIDALRGVAGWKSIHDRDGRQIEVQVHEDAEAALRKRREFVAEINAQLESGWSLQWCDDGSSR
jgi:hypothetical protein